MRSIEYVDGQVRKYLICVTETANTKRPFFGGDASPIKDIAACHVFFTL
jgi:hypothetical protein